MALQVYSTTKPASATRAWAATLGLLAGVTALAWTTSREPLNRILAPRESPPEWGFSFRVPKGFAFQEEAKFTSAVARRYEARSEDEGLVFTVWRFDPRGDLTPDRMCDTIIQASSESILEAIFSGEIERTSGQLGGQSALEIFEHRLPLVVRAVVLDDFGAAIAIRGRRPNQSTWERAYTLFDIAARSVEFTQSG